MQTALSLEGVIGARSPTRPPRPNKPVMMREPDEICKFDAATIGQLVPARRDKLECTVLYVQDST